MPYVSITGLYLKSPLHLPRFWWHAIRSMRQAQAAPGNLSAEARKVAGCHHTLSVWTDRDALRRYLAAGAHLQALRIFPSIATGKTHGYETDRIPNWDEALAIWSEKAREPGR